MMFDLIKVAVRNVGRNRRRSMITIFTIFIGVFVVTGARGLLNGLQGEIKSSLTRKINGDLQIHKQGYQDQLESNPYRILIPYHPGVVSQLKSIAGIQEVAPRLRTMGLLNHQQSQSTAPVMVNAYDSDLEQVVCPRLKNALQEGHLIDPALEETAEVVQDTNLDEAVGLDGPSPSQNTSSSLQAKGFHQVLVTPGLLRGMQAKVGDEVVLLLQDSHNMQQALIAHIVGVVDYAMPSAQAKMVWMDFRTLQATLGLEGYASEIAIRTQSMDDLDSIKSSLTSQIPQDQIVETWLELGGLFRDVMSLQNMVFRVVLVIIFLIVISAIVNTSLMTVMERTREIGTLMALGYRRVHIISLFLGEAITISLIGGLTGITAILAVLAFLNRQGLQFHLPGEAVGVILYPSVSVGFVMEVLALSISSALIASFYPAYRASHMRPVEALSSN